MSASLSCRHAPESGPLKLAIVPANLLITDAAQEWWQRATPIILQQDFATAHDVVARSVANVGSAYTLQSAELVTVTIESHGSGYELGTEVRDLKTQQAAQIIDSGPVPGILSALDAAARDIDSHATPFPSRNLNAVHAFVDSYFTKDILARLALLRQAVAADPHFGTAQVELVGLAAQSRQPETHELLARAKEKRKEFTALDGARFDLLAAQLEHAPSELPAKAVLAIARNDVEALAVLGSARFQAGDATAGERYLRKAYEVSGGNSALLVQLAEGQFADRQFERAAGTYAELGNAANYVLNRAAALLLAGKRSTADHLVDEALRQEGPVAGFHKAQWLAATGDFAGASALLESSAWPSPDARALALAQAAVWRLRLGEKDPAQRDSVASGQSAAGPVAREFAAIAILLTQGGIEGINAIAPGPNREVVLAYGLFLLGHYADSAKKWQQISRTLGGTDPAARAMLASCLEYLGQTNPAGTSVRPFQPNLSGNDPFAMIAFSEMRRLLRV